MNLINWQLHIIIIILSIMLGLDFARAGPCCEMIFDDYMKAVPYGAENFNCKETGSGCDGGYSISEEQSNLMKIAEKYEKRIAELEERMLGLRKAIACVTDISIYPEPGLYLAKDDELDCFVWKEDLSDVTVEPTSKGMFEPHKHFQ